MPPFIYQNKEKKMPGFEAILNGISAIGSAIQPLLNPAATIWNNERNIGFQKEENATTRQREDTAHQREVADLEAAGLSPLASVNGAQAQALNAPQAEAPQMDMSALNDAVATLNTKKIAEEELEQRKTEHRENLSHQQELLEQRKEEFRKTQELTKEIENARIKNEMEKYDIESARLDEELNYTMKKDTRETRIKFSQETKDSYNKICEQWDYKFPMKINVDYETYIIERNNFDRELQGYIEWCEGQAEPNTSEAWTKSKTNSQSTGMNVNSYGSGFGVNESTLWSKAESGSFTRDGKATKQGYMKKYIDKYCQEKRIQRNDFLVYPIYDLRQNEFEGTGNYKSRNAKRNYIK